MAPSPNGADSPPRARLWAVARAAVAVWRRELTESLREPHVLAFSLGFPVLFYPLLIWGATQLAMLQEGALEWSPPRVAVTVSGDGAAETADLETALATALFDEAGLQKVAAPPGGQAAAIESPAAGLDVWVEAEVQGARWSTTVHYLSTRSRSASGARKVEEALDALREEREQALALRSGAGEGALEVWSWEVEDVSPRGKTLGRLLGLVLPVVLLSAMMVAGIYPAVEIVVGEKERRTLETTLVSAAPRTGIVLGKMCALLTLIGISVAGNLGAMVLTIVHLLATMTTASASLDIAISPGAGVAAVGMLAIQGVMLAAVLVLACLPAQTFKQGQTVASLVSTLGMLPPMVAMMPTAELSWTMALLPVSNTALVLREAIAGDGAPAGPTLLAMAVNLALTAGLFWLALRLVAREQTWFGSGGGWVQRWIARLSGEGSA